MPKLRVFYTKSDDLRYISHLDCNRLMMRLFRRAEVEAGYTQGYNPHLDIAFALPLSLGFGSTCEAVDFTVAEDVDIADITARLAAAAPPGMEVLRVAAPVHKPGAITASRYTMVLTPASALEDVQKALTADLSAQKRTKKGTMVEVSLSAHLHDVALSAQDDMLHLAVTLPAGSGENVNPKLLADALSERCGVALGDVTRVRLFVGEDDFQ